MILNDMEVIPINYNNNVGECIVIKYDRSLKQLIENNYIINNKYDKQCLKEEV